MTGPSFAEHVLANRFSRYSDRIWLGNFTSLANAKGLERRAITAVCNLSGHATPVDDCGIKYLEVKQDDGATIEDVTLERFLEWMDEAWAEGHVVLLACAAGVSRTPSFLIAWLLHTGGFYGAADAISEWTRLQNSIAGCRPIIRPDPILRDSVLRYLSTREYGGAETIGPFPSG